MLNKSCGLKRSIGIVLSTIFFCSVDQCALSMDPRALTPPPRIPTPMGRPSTPVSRTPSPFYIDENPSIPSNIFSLSNPDRLWNFMIDEWVKEVGQGVVTYDPSIHKMLKIDIGGGAGQYSLLFASGRAKRPMPRAQRTFGRIDRFRKSFLSNLSSDEEILVNRLLVPFGVVYAYDSQYHWLIGYLPCDQELASLGLTSEGVDLVKRLWQKTEPERNPFQTFFAYTNCVFAYLKSEFTSRVYCLLTNAFPIYSPHFILTSTIPDKPQCIADSYELYDLLDLQKYLSRMGGFFQVNFNSNSCGTTLGGASVSVWHCQIVDLGIGDPSGFWVNEFFRKDDVIVGTYNYLKTTHRLFLSRNQLSVCKAAFEYISILHEANNAYNISLFVDAENNFRILLTIRGNWFEKNDNLDVKHTDTPGFAEAFGSFIFTNPEEYAKIKDMFEQQDIRHLKAVIESWHWAISQDLAIVERFDEEFKTNFR